MTQPGDQNGRRSRILLVDDEPLIRRSTCRLLEVLGHEVVTAADGAEAEARLRETPEIDLVLLDLLMPGQPVSQTFMALRTLRTGVPIVLCSGIGPEGEALRLLQEPFVTQLQKPFTLDQLSEAIGQVLARG